MPDTHKIAYRHAEMLGVADHPSLEACLRLALNDPEYGADYNKRIFVISDRNAKAFVDRKETNPPGVFAELLQLDSRRALPFVQHPESLFE